MADAASTEEKPAELLETRVVELGEEILDRSSEHAVGVFDKGYWPGKMMEWSMNFPKFKIEMFRFVDVLPSLASPAAVAEHLRQYFLRTELDLPSLMRAGLAAATSTGLTSKITVAAVRKNVEAMASTFIVGQDATRAKTALQQLWNDGFCFTIDILGEAAIAESEAVQYQQRYLSLVQDLAREVVAWQPQPILEQVPYGPVPRANVSVKCSSLYSQMDNLAFRGSVEQIKTRLRPILQVAVASGVFVNLDMEQHDYREMLLTVAEEIFCEPEFRGYPHFGLVLQAYLKSALADVDRVVAFAKTRAAPLTVRLVKGAYWDYEVIQARQRGWPIPVFTDKAATDENYERCAEKLLDAYPTLLSAFGSHNVRSLAFAAAYAEQRGLEKGACELQMLFGMAEPFKRALRSMGYRVREYAPVGEMLPGMAYLVRRLLENTSNEGFLRAKFVSHLESQVLLANPSTRKKPPKETAMSTPTAEFHNEPIRDFSQAAERTAMERALATVRSRLPIHVPAVVNGRSVTDLAEVEVKNPSRLDEVVTRYRAGTESLAEEALQASVMALQSWGKAGPAQRIAAIRKAGELLRARKDELAALMVLEVGKNFREADADVAEAVDFCFYYAAEYERLAAGRSMGSSPGESNYYGYLPRGSVVTIAPWNFPIAILCGMTVGPLVCGNPVIMKPAEQSTAIAFALFEVLREAGVPAEAVHLLPGAGEVIGVYLVQHPLTHIINFTGSRQVGLWIMEQGAKVVPGQKHLKRVVAELGGKNAIIIDDDADLDEAVAACRQSAFGYQGQKCSALSRLIVHEACYEKFKARLIEAMRLLRVGPADDPGTQVGPVIDAEARQRLLDVIERHRSAVVGQLEVPQELASQGHYVPPTVFESSEPRSELGQVEFFGPLVTLFKASNFDAAITIFNAVDYALTGGAFSRSPRNLERARAACECGNLYLNRGITGALVDRQPFGGFKLSGVGAKAGGPDYLLQFLEPRTITENTMRRGFAPEIS